MMGSPADEKGRLGDEGPQHEVTISRPFYLGVYTVTQEQYVAVMGENTSLFKSPNRPVEQANWEEAMEFCRKLSQKTGKNVTLPTEAQWGVRLFAPGSTTRFCFGDDEKLLREYAWYAQKGTGSTAPVGQRVQCLGAL